jgi:hypothetical protein
MGLGPLLSKHLELGPTPIMPDDALYFQVPSVTGDKLDVRFHGGARLTMSADSPNHLHAEAVGTARESSTSVPRSRSCPFFSAELPGLRRKAFVWWHNWQEVFNCGGEIDRRTKRQLANCFRGPYLRTSFLIPNPTGNLRPDATGGPTLAEDRRTHSWATMEAHEGRCRRGGGRRVPRWASAVRATAVRRSGR